MFCYVLLCFVLLALKDVRSKTIPEGRGTLELLCAPKSCKTDHRVSSYDKQYENYDSFLYKKTLTFKLDECKGRLLREQIIRSKITNQRLK